jgi:transcriptional regulator with XRE-family HTH domain
MNGKEFKQLLKLNGLRQEDAAKIFDVSRQTISTWCKQEVIDDKIVKLIFERFRVTDPSTSPISIVTGAANVVGNNNSNIDNRQYYSDSPDVLRAQIEVLDERIKEKDAQIKEKDAQIKELLNIVSNLSKHD